MTFFRHFWLKAYPRIVRCVKHSWGSGRFLFRVFCLEEISMKAIFRTFFTCYNCVYVTYTNITKALNVRENKIKNISWPDWEIRICEGWLNPYSPPYIFNSPHRGSSLCKRKKNLTPQKFGIFPHYNGRKAETMHNQITFMFSKEYHGSILSMHTIQVS